MTPNPGKSAAILQPSEPLKACSCGHIHGDEHSAVLSEVSIMYMQSHQSHFGIFSCHPCSFTVHNVLDDALMDGIHLTGYIQSVRPDPVADCSCFSRHSMFPVPSKPLMTPGVSPQMLSVPLRSLGCKGG